GALENPRPSAVLGLHVTSNITSGQIALRPGGLMASADRRKIGVRGRQTHASMPWRGVDPVVISAQIILALQTIITRQIDSTVTPAVLSVSTIHGGVRTDIKRRIEKTAKTIAELGGAHATFETGEGVPVTYNDPALTQWGSESLGDGVGAERV